MNSTVSTRRTLERKSREFEVNMEMSRARIVEGIRIAQDKLRRVETELLSKLEAFFGSNVYSEYLTRLESDEPNSLEEATSIATTPVPANFGPDEKAFGKLYDEISRLAHKTTAQAPVPSAPKNLAARGVGKNEFYDGMSLSWSGVDPAVTDGVECVRYKVHVVNEHKMARVYDSAGTSCVFQNLKHGVTYGISVRCIWDDRAGPWCSPVEFTTSPVPVPVNVKCAEVKECEASIVWDPSPVDIVWEMEVCKNDPSKSFRKVYEGSEPSFTVKYLECNTGYIVRVRGKTKDEKCGSWCDALEIKTKKWTCSWKRDHGDGNNARSYYVKGETDNIAERVVDYQAYMGYSHVIGTNLIPIGTIVSWDVKINGTGRDFKTGIEYLGRGQGPPDAYEPIYFERSFARIHHVYGGFGIFSVISDYYENLQTGYRSYVFNTISIIVDTQKGEITFMAKGATLGTIRQIPLDAPIVPFVELREKDTTAKLIIN